jgi:mannose-6-phosphate isomerase-like protein (cupin superfamily)
VAQPGRLVDDARVSARDWQVARIEDVPALPPTDDPDFWRAWTEDPDFSRGWHSAGRHLGARAFGLNAKTAEAGRELVARHAESEFAPQDELYVVVRGRARFVCDGQAVEVAPGDLLLVGPDVVREAVALETPTQVVVIGGVPGKAYEAPEWNAG